MSSSRDFLRRYSYIPDLFSYNTTPFDKIYNLKYGGIWSRGTMSIGYPISNSSMVESLNISSRSKLFEYIAISISLKE